TRYKTFPIYTTPVRHYKSKNKDFKKLMGYKSIHYEIEISKKSQNFFLFFTRGPSRVKRYLQEYNRGNLCVINIESVKALENLDELLSVPGLDAVFIGPHDLSVSLGLPEDYDHPVFEKAVKMIIEKCRTHNVAVGIHFSETPDRQIQWIEAGVNIVIHSSDIA